MYEQMLLKLAEEKWAAMMPNMNDPELLKGYSKAEQAALKSGAKKEITNVNKLKNFGKWIGEHKLGVGAAGAGALALGGGAYLLHNKRKHLQKAAESNYFFFVKKASEEYPNLFYKKYDMYIYNMV